MPKTGLKLTPEPKFSEEPFHLLCLGAHADDIEIGAGGLILSLLSERPGSLVTWVIASASDIREAEGRESAEALVGNLASLDLRFLGQRDGYFDRTGPALKERFEQVRQTLNAEPDMILTHYRHDRHQDHRAVSDITWNLWRDHLILEYEIPKWDGDLGTPNTYLPLAEKVAERKVAHLSTHFLSQRGKDWYDSETITGLMRIRGMECRSPSRYAEGFYARKISLEP